MNAGIEEAARVVLAGRVAAVATESFFGLLADAMDPAAVELVFALKGRAATEPMPVLVRDAGDVARLAAEVPSEALEMMARHWPGPLTIVLPARPEVPALVCGGTGKIGLRIPGPCPAADVLRLCGRPVTATSANRSGAPPLTRGEDVRALFGEALASVVDGTAPGGLPSTVVDATVRPFRILRQGALLLPTS